MSTEVATQYEPVEVDSTTGLLSWVSTVDHKRIGILYILLAVFFLLVGGIEAVLIRMQLAVPRNTFLSPEVFNQLFTMHGTTMVFLVGMPFFTGFSNYLVPLMIGAKDVAFPRLNAMSFWMLPFGAFLLVLQLPDRRSTERGLVFLCSPLDKTVQPRARRRLLDRGSLVMGVGSIAGAINIIATVLCCAPLA